MESDGGTPSSIDARVAVDWGEPRGAEPETRKAEEDFK